jgi:hypothetical protein
MVLALSSCLKVDNGLVPNPPRSSLTCGSGLELFTVSESRGRAARAQAAQEVRTADETPGTGIRPASPAAISRNSNSSMSRRSRASIRPRFV